MPAAEPLLLVLFGSLIRGKYIFFLTFWVFENRKGGQMWGIVVKNGPEGLIEIASPCLIFCCFLWLGIAFTALQSSINNKGEFVC